ncbi:phosphoketolase family protein [Nakamurella leprariae]|uniref:Phosphoketolase family protein n=1 Tax=Nakamurella leprariae TaxID=2803911 RepID=A0A939BYA9_9ACTN|nr:phosphoketolase family protein [Nakamurella leprariae]MBM9469373.1 phosphoketolase family protein [Nakamurella leprariae]
MSIGPAPEDVAPLARYRRAADYLAAAMIFLRDNVLLEEPLRPDHLKPRLLGHWGTCPGITLVYAGLDRLIGRTGADVLLVTGPGHGAPANHANLWLEGAHERFDPALTRDRAGLTELVRRFSWPGGFPSHLSPEVPGVIHEGGELGYALATAYGAALDAPDRIVACLVGDGEAETGPTAAAWHSTKYLDPATSGAVLPIVHGNGWKIASPTQTGVMSDDELTALYRGYGHHPIIVYAEIDYTEGAVADERLGVAMDEAYDRITGIQRQARSGRRPERPAWPVIVLRTRKGWGLPAELGGSPLEGTFHAHQVPMEDVAEDPEQLAALEAWLRSYRPEELFDDGRPVPAVLAVCPPEERRMGTNPAAVGGDLRRPLDLPEIADFAQEVGTPGTVTAGATAVLASWLAEVFRRTETTRDFRIVCPDELESNKLTAVLEATDRAFSWPVPGSAEHLDPAGRVMEVLSEHDCQGWLQGYLLTGRHGLFPCYEAFVSIVDGMVNQYAKFLKLSREVPWRTPVSALNYLLTSEGWRQEHNGYSHQGPGFINTMLTKKAETTAVYLPPDANTLLAVMRTCLASTDRINLVVAGKNPAVQWLSLSDAVAHCAAGASVWAWASHPAAVQERADVVLACAGGVPTVETLAATEMLRRDAPELRMRVVNVVDLVSLRTPQTHPHGLSEDDFRALFGDDLPVVFDFHGYPSAVHQLLHGRPDPGRFHVRGYVEEGTTTTPYDLLASNGVTRHDLAIAVLQRARGWASAGGDLADRYARQRDDILTHVRRTGQDPAEITDWTWGLR